jgi:Fe-S oxidoreductase
MAAYKAEFLDHHYRRRLRPRSHYSLGWLPVWLRLTARLPRVVNAVTRSRPTRGLFARAAGIAPSRGIPPLARRTFRRDWRPRPRPAGAAPHGRVVLWPDTYNDHLTPEVAHAAVRVLEAAGFVVMVPRRWVCDGLTWHSTGQLGSARRVLRHSLGAPELGGDEPVVVLEPSTAAMLRADLPQLLPDDPRASRLARRVATFAEVLDRVEFVAPAHPAPEASAPAICQPHCHQQAILGLAADRRVYARNGIAVGDELVGCCGLAGNFGAEPGHEQVSRKVAELALVPALQASPDAPVLADGFSCRTQVESLSGRRARHLAEVLAERLPQVT